MNISLESHLTPIWVGILAAPLVLMGAGFHIWEQTDMTLTPSWWQNRVLAHVVPMSVTCVNQVLLLLSLMLALTRVGKAGVITSLGLQSGFPTGDKISILTIDFEVNWGGFLFYGSKHIYQSPGFA